MKKTPLFSQTLLCASALALCLAIAPQASHAVTPQPQPMAAAPQQVNLKPLLALNPVSPADRVRNFYRVLEATMRDGEALHFQGRADRLKPAFEQSFNIAEMTRMAVGPAWAKCSPEQQDKLIKAFGAFSLANYASRFTRYHGEVFRVTGERKNSREGEMVVDTQLVSGDDTVQLSYLLKQGEKGWQIVDVFVDGSISEIATRRSEFSPLIRTQGADALFKMLQEKSTSLATES